MSKPFISICIPTYKRVDLLAKLLDSINIQTFRDFEILVNDNSPDDSVAQLVKTYAGILPISYQQNSPSTTAGINCIKVMRRAGGEWIKIMHDDDWFAQPDALQQFADAAANNSADFIFCGTSQVYLETGRMEEDLLTADEKKMLDESSFALFYLNVIGHPSAAMHRADLAIEYDATLNWVVDIDFYMRYLLAHPGYIYLPQKLVNIGKSAGQETSRYYKNIGVELTEYFRLLAKYEPSLGISNEYVFHLIWNMLKRYKIKDTAQIHAAGYKGPLPDKIDEIIAFQQKIPRLIIKQPRWSKWWMKRCFGKLSLRSLMV